MTWKVENASFFRFDRHFASKLRCLMLSDNPKIPKALMHLVRPMDKPHSLKVSHNWGDINPYLVSTIIRVYGFKGTPHVLPYQVPLKVGIAEFFWQLGGVEETFLHKRGTGSIFPTCTIAHQFVITKEGWIFLHKILDQYKMAVSHARFCDTEGFFNSALRLRIKLRPSQHDFYFHEDIIRNEYSLHEKEIKKAKWRVYSKVLEFINFFDKDYSPLSNAATNADKINKLMNTFSEIMEVMNEKKQHFIDSFLDKAREVMRKLGFTPNIGMGPLVVRKKKGYTVVQQQMPIVNKEK